MAHMSQDAFRALQQQKANDRSAQKPIKTSPSSVGGYFHNYHHLQPLATRLLYGDSDEEQKSVSLLQATSGCRQGKMQRLFSIDENPSLREDAAAAAAAEKERSGKKPSTEIRRNSFPKTSISCNKSGYQSGNHSLFRKQEKQRGGIRWKEPLASSQRTLQPLHDDSKSSVSCSLPTSGSSEANMMHLGNAALQQLQEEQKPFRISPMGYDSRYEDLIHESSQCYVDDDIAPEQTTQAIDKCKLWLKKHHMDNYESRAKHH